jgi:uncharacterized lipoprotein NlpE involved in copper resistance
MLRLVLLVLLLCGCINGQLFHGSWARKKVLYDAPPGPLEFQKGWKDACQTARAAQANSFYKTVYKDFVKDTVLSSSDYEAGWTYGFWFCGRYYEVENYYSGFL